MIGDQSNQCDEAPSSRTRAMLAQRKKEIEQLADAKQIMRHTGQIRAIEQALVDGVRASELDLLHRRQSQVSNSRVGDGLWSRAIRESETNLQSFHMNRR
jgi:hypothetical protein